MSGEDFITLTPNYELMLKYGLDIFNDAAYNLTRIPRHPNLSDVQNLLAGLNMALCSIPVSEETLVVLDAITTVLDEKIIPAVYPVLNEG